jgi:hypothetical protein
MTPTAWAPGIEPAEVVALRNTLASADQTATDFWAREDLAYLGDLAWCEQDAMRGHEYIANVQLLDQQITYQYGMINLDGAGAVAGSLVCNVRAKRLDGYPFEMQINGEWLPGPLQFWLDQLAPAIQDLARERYRLVIGWAEGQAS